MPFGYVIDPEHHLVFLRGWGVITEEDAFRLSDVLPRESAFHPDLRVLADLTAVERMETSARLNLVYVSPFNPSARRAIVVHEGDSMERARHYAATRVDSGSVLIAGDMAQAQGWLGLPEGYEAPEPDTVHPV